MNTRQPEARRFDAGVALVISIIAFTVAMLLPSRGRAQDGGKFEAHKPLLSISSIVPEQSLVICSKSSKIRFDLSKDTISATMNGNIDLLAQSFIDHVVMKYNQTVTTQRHIIDSLTRYVDTLPSRLLPAPMPLGTYQTLEIQPAPMPFGTFSHTMPDGKLFLQGGSIGIGNGIGNVQSKKDTVTVEVMCLKTRTTPTLDALVVKSNGDSYSFPYVTAKKQERTLEWQTVSLPVTSRNGMTPAINVTETKWVTTATRWLENTSGCYQLVPLQND